MCASTLTSLDQQEVDQYVQFVSQFKIDQLRALPLFVFVFGEIKLKMKKMLKFCSFALIHFYFTSQFSSSSYLRPSACHVGNFGGGDGPGLRILLPQFAGLLWRPLLSFLFPALIFVFVFLK